MNADTESNTLAIDDGRLESWAGLSLEDQLSIILNTSQSPSDFLDTDALLTFARVWHEPVWQARIEARFQELRGYPPNLRKAVEAVIVRLPRKTADAAPKEASVSIWDEAISAKDWLAQDDEVITADVKDLVVPGCITIIAAPRASGKSIVMLFLGVALARGGLFRSERLRPRRVLVVDRDNSKHIVKTRLRHLGAYDVADLLVLTRDKAPPLTDTEAWRQFPVHRFDVVIVDSIGSSTEGVSEREGRETQLYLATLKDLASRGPAVLALDNTDKTGRAYRGRGEKGDSVDILYEARNITGWTPPNDVDWWRNLPDFGEHSWQERASRRKGQTVMRIAFVPSKFRLAMEPDPFCLEIDTTATPWTLRDITEMIAVEGVQVARETREVERAKLEQAAAHLVKIIHARPLDSPLLKEDAIRELMTRELSKRQARNLLEFGYNRDTCPIGFWVLREVPNHRGGAVGVYLYTETLARKVESGGNTHDGKNTAKNKAVIIL